MDILGIGIPELAFIILIALIVLGPKDMQKAGKTIGTWMRNVVLSPEWREIKDASSKLKRLPNQLIRDANMDVEEFRNDINNIMPNDKKTKATNEQLDASSDASYGSWSGMSVVPNSETMNSIAPPADEDSAPAKTTNVSQTPPPVNKTAPAEKGNNA